MLRCSLGMYQLGLCLKKRYLVEERMVKREESERQRKLKLNEAACHLGGRRDR